MAAVWPDYLTARLRGWHSTHAGAGGLGAAQQLGEGAQDPGLRLCVPSNLPVALRLTCNTGVSGGTPSPSPSFFSPQKP